MIEHSFRLGTRGLASVEGGRERVASRVLMLLNLRRGELPWMSKVGSRLRDLLFNDPRLAMGMIGPYVREALAPMAGTIVVDVVNGEFDEDNQALNIEISYKIINTDLTDTVRVEITA